MIAEGSATRVDKVALTSPGARALMWIYFVTHAGLAMWTLDGVYSPFPTLLALVAFGLVCVVFTVDRAIRLTLPSTLLVIALCLLGTVLVIWQLRSNTGYASWNFGAAGGSLFFLALRGRIALAWVGFALVTAVVLYWGASTFHGVPFAFSQMTRQVAVLIVGTLFATGLKRSADQVERLSAEATVRALSETQQVAIEEEREARLRALGEVVTPLLERLAAGAPISTAERENFALAEAELRDGLRGRALQHPVVITAARSARQRGVEVVLLDDSDGMTDLETLGTVAARVAAMLDVATEGRVTARLLPPGRDSLATIVLDGAEHRSDIVSSNP